MSIVKAEHVRYEYLEYDENDEKTDPTVALYDLNLEVEEGQEGQDADG